MVELKNVAAGYGKRRVLEGVSACFEKGKLTGIIGINGCGKSTLLKTVSGVLPVRCGEILVDGQALSAMKRGEIARRVSYLAQGKSTPDMTVEQLVLLGRFPYLSYPRQYKRRDREIASEALRIVGISELASHPMSTLSGGMRQCAYMAMALTQDTDYILLDEPTTYLDISHQLALMRLLRCLAERGKGMVAVMHDLPMAFDFFDELLLLDGGKVLLQGSPEEISVSREISRIFGVELQRSPESGHYTYRYR